MARQPRSRSGVRLTERDLAAVAWIAEQRAVRLDTVGRLLRQRQQGVDPRALRRLAERWTDAGLIARKRILATAPTILWPTVEGLRCAGITLKPGHRADPPSIGLLLHTLAAAEIRLAYESNGYAWTAERLLDAVISSSHRADALAVRDTSRVLVEVERTQKSRERVEDILRINLRTPTISECHYWVTDSVRGVVEVATAALEPDLAQRVRIALIPEVVR